MADAAVDRFLLAELPADRYSTFIMAHVLEHFAEAPAVLRTLLRSCRRLGVQRFIVVVPGWKGYLSDGTHKSFIDRATRTPLPSAVMSWATVAPGSSASSLGAAA